MQKIFIILLAVSSLLAVSTKKIYNVDGMMCEMGCANTIKGILKDIDGIESFSLDFSTKKLEILFDSDNLTFDKISSSLPNPYKISFIKETVEKEYSVSGMTCMGCVSSIKNSLQDLDGLDNYSVDFDKGVLYIDFDTKKIDDKKILSKIPGKFKVVEIASIEEEVEEKKENLNNKHD